MLILIDKFNLALGDWIWVVWIHDGIFDSAIGLGKIQACTKYIKHWPNRTKPNQIEWNCTYIIFGIFNYLICFIWIFPLRLHNVWKFKIINGLFLLKLKFHLLNSKVYSANILCIYGNNFYKDGKQFGITIFFHFK